MPVAGPGVEVVWRSATVLEVDGVEYRLMDEPSRATVGLRLLKNREMIEGYDPVVAEFQGANCVELGIFEGGSTAFLAQVLQPRRLVAVDIAPAPVERLEAFLAARSLTDTVRTHYGVDQSDRATLTAIVAGAFDPEPLDLVIDDASHLYQPTVASFDVLFPRIRSGGLYVIEDWRANPVWFTFLLDGVAKSDATHADAVRAAFAEALAASAEGSLDPDLQPWVRLYVNAMRSPTSADHATMAAWYQALGSAGAGGASLVGLLDHLLADPRPPADAWSDDDPSLVALATELVVLASERPDVLSSVEVGPHWISIRRGPAPLDPDAFHLRDLYRDRMALLARSNRRAEGTAASDRS
jgi:predicted O-methyltransferase YrrM